MAILHIHQKSARQFGGLAIMVEGHYTSYRQRNYPAIYAKAVCAR